jgi:hypothetical protein
MRECECGGKFDDADGATHCAACEADRLRALAHYGPLYRVGALDPVGPWRSRDEIIRSEFWKD